MVLCKDHLLCHCTLFLSSRYGSKEGFVPAAYLARYRGVVGQSASPVVGVASTKDALSPTAGQKAIAPIPQSSTPFTPGSTQKKTGYDDERKLLCVCVLCACVCVNMNWPYHLAIYCHIPRRKSIDVSINHMYPHVPYVPPCSSMYPYVPPCSFMYPYVLPCSSMYPYVPPCSSMYPYVHPCSSGSYIMCSCDNPPLPHTHMHI